MILLDLNLPTKGGWEVPAEIIQDPKCRVMETPQDNQCSVSARARAGHLDPVQPRR
jgi:hypothetical protein